MRTINADILTKLISGAYTAVLAVKLTVDAVDYRYVSHPADLILAAERYQSRNMTLGPGSYSESVIVDSSSLTIDNRDSVLTPVFITGDVQGAAVEISLAVLGPAGTFLVLPLFEGTVDEYSLDEAEVQLTVASPMAPWDETFLDLHSPSCRWKDFGGTQCKYAGAELICDRTYERCSALNNTDNFGGFRWLPSIENKTVWWGRKADLPGRGR